MRDSHKYIIMSTMAIRLNDSNFCRSNWWLKLMYPWIRPLNSPVPTSHFHHLHSLTSLNSTFYQSSNHSTLRLRDLSSSLGISMTSSFKLVSQWRTKFYMIMLDIKGKLSRKGYLDIKSAVGIWVIYCNFSAKIKRLILETILRAQKRHLKRMQSTARTLLIKIVSIERKLKERSESMWIAQQGQVWW
jgi:hypothetical protein